MKILKVIHGYPMRYNAGSEVYSQTLCQGLANHHEVHVFTRQEDPFKSDYEMQTEVDPLDPRILVHVVNIPRIKNSHRYRHTEVDSRFADLLLKLQPDIVHVGHLNHLSTSLIDVVHQQKIPLVYTLHDYWLMCPRGQFIQRNSKEPWQLCNGQEDKKCAEQCFKGSFSGVEEEEAEDLSHWTHWVSRRMDHMRSIASHVDLFIAPSRYLLERFKQDFSIDENKLIYLDYGFDHKRLEGRQRVKGQEPFVFGYIGTHIPSKGVQDLILAFNRVQGDCRLRIWGRSREETDALKRLVATLPKSTQERIEWRGEYRNQEILKDVFNQVDAIVVPSIWVENSPLVIHEALQARVPVITADVGGMAEYVQHEVNGLLFRHRDQVSLTEQMQRFLSNPAEAEAFGKKGYLQSVDGNIPDIQDHVKAIEGLYHQVLAEKSKHVSQKAGPWRITFDTNPDHCNYNCIMCECFSPYSSVKKERLKAGLPRREMSIDLIRKVLEEAQGTPLREIIPSTMGEPLLYQDFEKIIELCHEFNVKLNLTTNGSFPRMKVDEWARLLVPVCSDIKISWNGASKETNENIMLGSHWERSLNNLKTLIHIRDEHAEQGGNRCSVTLQLTFLESNVDELGDIVRLGVSLGVDRIKGHHLWAHFKEIKNLSMRRSKEAIARWNNAARLAQTIAAETLLPTGKSILLENIHPLDESADVNLVADGVCPFLGKEAWVNTQGRFSPCCAPDEARRALGDFGDLKTKTMDEIWQSPEYQELRKNYMNYPLCVGCNMRKSLSSLYTFNQELIDAKVA